MSQIAYMSNEDPDLEIKIGVKEDRVVFLWWDSFNNVSKTPWKDLQIALKEAYDMIEIEVEKEREIKLC